MVKSLINIRTSFQSNMTGNGPKDCMCKLVSSEGFAIASDYLIQLIKSFNV